MKKEDKAYVENIRQKLIELTAGSRNSKDRVSDRAVARGTGRSNAAVNLFKNDNYTGDNLKLAQQIDRWMTRIAEKQKARGIFTETINTFAITKVNKACRIAHVEGKIVVITGEAGVGKTKGVEKYVEENPDVIHVQVIPYYQAKDVMADIHRAVGYNGEGRLIDMFKHVQEKLEGTNRLLLIDEAELLPYRGLELVRRLYDMTGIGVAMVGMPKLIRNMKGRGGEYKQLYSRVAVHADIPSLDGYETQDHTADQDIQALVKSVLPNSNGTWKKFANITRNARTLANLIDQSIRIADKNDCEITDEIIAKAKKLIII